MKYAPEYLAQNDHVQDNSNDNSNKNVELFTTSLFRENENVYTWKLHLDQDFIINVSSCAYVYIQSKIISYF